MPYFMLLRRSGSPSPFVFNDMAGERISLYDKTNSAGVGSGSEFSVTPLRVPFRTQLAGEAQIKSALNLCLG